MTKTDVYNADYTKLNSAYIDIYDTCQRLAQCKDVDVEVLSILEQILFAFNPTLDKIKSEMTVKTKFKNPDEEIDEVKTEVSENGTKIFHPNFE